jgi:hypothetical protein
MIQYLDVQKLGYASNPWRLVHMTTRQELYAPRAITSADGKRVAFSGPVCFATRREADAYLLTLLRRAAAANERALAILLREGCRDDGTPRDDAPAWLSRVMSAVLDLDEECAA